MSILGRIFIFIILASIALYTASFGNWTWKHKNRLGAIMVYALALTVLVLPLYTLFFRH